MKPGTAYEDCVVGYIDILGFRDLVRGDQVEIIIEAMKIIRRRRRRVDRFPESPLHHTMFSDLIVFSAKRVGDGLLALVHVVSYLAADLLIKGIYCRGAVTAGPLHHRGDVIFGPALIEAYDLERQLALYPRILIPLDLAEDFVSQKNVDRPKSRRNGIGQYFRRDFDNQYHLDVLSPWLSRPPRPGLVSNTVVKPVRAQVLKQLDGSERIEAQRKQAKLCWLLDYLEYVNEVHGALKMG